MFHRNTEKLESFIGSNSVFKGKIETQGTLRIDGVVEGNVSADWVVVGEKAHIKGDISARGIIVGGRIDGNLKAKEVIEVKNKGHVFGEIMSKKLVIAEGGIFEGRSLMPREDIKVIEFQAVESSK